MKEPGNLIAASRKNNKKTAQFADVKCYSMYEVNSLERSELHICREDSALFSYSWHCDRSYCNDNYR